ncbi:MAG: hypothetical protein ACRD21_08605 [Vicinamibacteria bacterium]
MREEHPSIDEWNEYLDGDPENEVLRKLDAHLAPSGGAERGCEECRLVVEELLAVVRAASEMPAIHPPERIWESIAVSLRERRSFTASPAAGASFGAVGFWALAAAALLLGVALWLVVLRTPGEPREPGEPGDNAVAAPGDPLALANMITEELRAAESHYDKAIVGLEQILAQNHGVLPSELATVLNQNLDLIEGAIDESRAAIQTDPRSAVAQESLLQALRRKVTLLQNTILLINEVRKGQGESALDLIDEMRNPTDPSNPI